MTPRNRLLELHTLAYKLPNIGGTSDLASLTIVELSGLYAFLRRISEGG